MLDIRFVREHPDAVKKNLQKRHARERIPLLEDLLRKDTQWRQLRQKIDLLRQRRNAISQEINEIVKKGQSPDAQIKEAKLLPQEISTLEHEADVLKTDVDLLLLRMPNLLHPEVPSGKDAHDNPQLRKWGTPTKFSFELKSHEDLLEGLGCANFEAGRTNAGQGFNYLLGPVARLDHALQRYGVDFLLKKGFRLVVPPMLLKKDVLLGALNGLHDFEQVVYKLAEEDLYLIGTAEHSLVTLMKGRLIRKEDLPLKVCAVTPCFRKEIGAHGVDTKGLFRMHQFNKVEQVVFCEPKDSDKRLEEMQKITEKFFQSLKIPYRVVEICAGDLGDKFARQYDIEAWFPRQKKYAEVTSAGSCTDFQARALNIRYQDGKEAHPVHVLNNTMVATSRAMVAILENYQRKDGTLKVPRALWPYMHPLRTIQVEKGF